MARLGSAFAVVSATVVLALSASSALAASPTLLRLDGIGPLKLGMTTSTALATGWLAGKRPGCELAGPNPPVTYRLTGPHAPKGIRGVAEFDGGRLANLAFTRGVRTATGVVAGRTTTGDMVSRYGHAGYAASALYDPTFAGTFVTIKRKRRQLIGAFGVRSTVTTLAIPFVPVCE